MESFKTLTASAAPLDRVNVDTDQIIPKQFLKRIERTGYGQFLFIDWMQLPDGSPNPDFILNKPGYENPSILLSGRNFGCGSSREHAPWALMDFGFQAIIAPSYADIFRNNCYQNGLLPVALAEKEVAHLISNATTNPGYLITVDLENQQVSAEENFTASFEIDEFRRYCLLNGLDDIGLTLLGESKITEYEKRTGIIS